jgi:hypothetical protein
MLTLLKDVAPTIYASALSNMPPDVDEVVPAIDTG